MLGKQRFFDFFILLCLSLLVFLIGISQTTASLWEPWETSTVLVAQNLLQSTIDESAFWVPQSDGVLVAQPYLELWLLTALLRVFPDPNAFILRLPGAFIGIILTLLTFFAVRQASTRRTAWTAAIILLTIPMFVLTGKFIHGDIWLIFAVAVPNLFYIMACYASTRRMQRLMLCMTSLSVFISFLTGGLFAIAILAVEALITALLLGKHRKRILKPLLTKFFLVPLYISFVIIGSVFSIYVTQARYELENRMPLTLSALNRALDEDRVVTIERRNTQIIGSLKSEDADQGQKNFILVESEQYHNTDATEIFSLNETDQRAFENYLMWRFQKKEPAKAARAVPIIDDAFPTALRFFWYRSNTPYDEPKITLARAALDLNDSAREDAWIRSSESLLNKTTPKTALDFAESALATPAKLHAGELVRVLNDDPNSEWVEIQNGAGNSGFVPRDILTILQDNSHIHWFSWLQILLFGLFPWSCFFPLVIACAFISYKKLSIAQAPFYSEFIQIEECSEKRSLFQNLLISWTLASILALFVGINFTRHDIFAGVIPVAILLAVAVTSPVFWKSIRNSLESRLLFIAAAIACCVIVFLDFKKEAFHLVRYILTNPLMHWDSSAGSTSEYYGAIAFTYLIFFVLLTIISFSGAVETIQEHISNWRQKNPSQPREYRSSSSTTLMRISRNDEEPMPYAPVISLTLLASVCAIFIYFNYIPTISNNFTETELINEYFEYADNSEPVYLLSGENAQLCQTYKDCEPGYICKNSHCRISTFLSYSLSVARPISRSNMIQSLSPNNESFNNSFYIIPKAALYVLNQSYRAMFSRENRQNLKVIHAPSARLYLIANHKDLPSVNPFESIFIRDMPEDATKLPSPVQLDDKIVLEGFKMNQLDFSNAKKLEMTLYYHLNNSFDPNDSEHHFLFSFEVSNRKLEFERTPLNGQYDTKRIIAGDLVADTFTFELSMMPEHGYIDVWLSTNDSRMPQERMQLTTIDF